MKIAVIRAFLLHFEFSETEWSLLCILIQFTVKNISNAFGIAPVFIENRLQYLKNEGYIEYKNKFVQITLDGENAVKLLMKSYSM